jgi:trehalose 6-phosphate phosphatase
MTDIPLPDAGARWCFFLDIDGTLLAIAATPGAVRVGPELTELLHRLSQVSGGAVALVSGRRLADIDALFGGAVVAAAGLHGLERRRADGSLDLAQTAPDLLAPVQAAFYAHAATRPGLLLENKGQTIALHYRLAPEEGDDVRRLGRWLVDEAGGALRLLDGDRVVEVQPSGFDKGRAVRSFLTEPPFLGRRPVFIGDDVTDEDGFASVVERGGIAIRVARGRAPPAATVATSELATTDAVHAWLRAVVDRLDQDARRRGGAAAASPAGLP